MSYLLTGGFWPTIVLQALLVAAATVMTIFRFDAARTRPATASLLPPILLLATSAPYFAGFVMPDVFVPLAILALANIVLFWERDAAWSRAFWVFLLGYGALTHSATLLLIVLLAGLGLILALAGFARIPRAAAGAIVGAILAGVAGEIAFSMTVRDMTGRVPVRPPFLTARIVDDGPGYRYLRKTCPGNGFALCRLIDRPPVNSDAFLWSPRRGEGSFLSGSTQDARRVSEEQGRFVLAVLRDRPLELVGSSLGAIGRQTGMIDLSEFNYEKGTREHLDRKLPQDLRESVARSPAYRGRLPTKFVTLLTLPLVLASLAIVAMSCVRAGRPGRAPAPATLFSLIILAGIVLNIAISGAISTPHDRYNMRALWLLPILAAALLPMLRRDPAP